LAEAEEEISEKDNFNSTNYDSDNFYRKLWGIDKETARNFATTLGLSYNGAAINNDTTDTNAIYGSLI
jgi:hypothetical protein